MITPRFKCTIADKYSMQAGSLPPNTGHRKDTGMTADTDTLHKLRRIYIL